jgi:hypothetical protein
VEWFEGDTPDIVLADVDVPEIDGYALAEFVKQSPQLRNVPVLLLAGAFEPIDQERADAAGCDGVLVKPFEPQQLVTRVKALLERVQQPAMAGAPGDYPQQGGRSSSPFGGMSIGGFDAVAEPEPLEPPSRPVWELGLPDPITPARPAAAQPAAQSAAPPKVTLVNAFSALLAAEQTKAPSAAAASPVTEATVEDAVRRVLVRMTDDLVRRIVLETAERLIKEEIEKIKANPE